SGCRGRLSPELSKAAPADLACLPIVLRLLLHDRVCQAAFSFLPGLAQLTPGDSTATRSAVRGEGGPQPDAAFEWHVLCSHVRDPGSAAANGRIKLVPGSQFPQPRSAEKWSK